MNNNFLNALNNLKEDIFCEPLVKEYLNLKNKINESKELSKLKNKINYYKKCDINDNEKEEYFNILKVYENTPLIIQFNNISEDTFSLLNEIKEELEK